jgi:hypothetical protein
MSKVNERKEWQLSVCIGLFAESFTKEMAGRNQRGWFSRVATTENMGTMRSYSTSKWNSIIRLL